jgi:hypothetical protein
MESVCSFDELMFSYQSTIEGSSIQNTNEAAEGIGKQVVVRELDQRIFYSIARVPNFVNTDSAAL